MLRLVLVLAALGTAFTGAHAADSPYPKGQLPETVVPRHYSVDLMVLPEDLRFSGRVAIDVELMEPSTTIWLHGQDLTVEAARVTPAGASPMAATFEEIAKSGGVAKVVTSQPIPAGKARIEIAYSAPFNRQLEGLYRSDEGGDSYAFSQMEPISARLAFPSFDEPRFKTPFDTTLTVRQAHTAVSNTPVVKEEKLANGLKKVTFATTKPLPTYLIAFAVGPLDVVEWKPIRKTDIRNVEIPLRGITARGKGPQIKYALENTEALLVTLEAYFGTPYPYEKLDLIAATDFSAGAMENAGAIVYREALMLFEANPPLSQKRRYALTHAHEMAHQWFGNLVTPAWWDDIWLNEAFATWMEYKTAQTWNPQGEYERLSLAGSLAAMESDSWRNARQIAQPIASNDDIANAFDSITYDKGGGVLDMFEAYYGAENFRRGVKLHLDRYRFGVATSKDFLQSVADASSDTEGVAAFQTFLNQPGVPVVETELKCGARGAKLQLRQSRYAPLSERSEAAPPQSWTIPMCVAYGSRGERAQVCGMVKGREAELDLKTAQCPAWVMPNAQGAGYFRFGLERRQWDALIANATQLSEKEVLSSLDSLEAAFMAGTIDVGDYLERMRALVNRGGKLAPWDIASAPMARLVWIKDTLVGNGLREKVKAYIGEIYGPYFDQLGLDPTSALDKSNPIQATLMRTPVVSMVALHAERTDVRKALAERGARYIGLGGDGKINTGAVDPSLVEQSLTVAVQDLGSPAVDAMIRHLKTERSALIRSRLLSALTRTRDPVQAEKVRALALSQDLRVNEVPIVVFGSVREPATADGGWEWFKANFDAISARTPPGNQGDLALTGARFCAKDKRKDYEAFLGKRIEGMTGGPRTMAQTLEQIDACQTLTTKQRGKAEKFFSAPPGGGS